MYQLVTCVTASCDQCGADAETDDGIAHYYSQTGAETALADADWRVLAGGRLLCPPCASARDCAVHDHQWTHWIPCACKGVISDHRAQDGRCGVEWRYCERCCDTTQERPAEVDATQENTDLPRSERR